MDALSLLQGPTTKKLKFLSSCQRQLISDDFSRLRTTDMLQMPQEETEEHLEMNIDHLHQLIEC